MTQSVSTALPVHPTSHEYTLPSIQKPANPPSQLKQIGKKILSFSLAESLGMGVNYAAGYASTWMLGSKNPSSHGAMSALQLPANQVLDPVFKTIFRCSPLTTHRTMLANQITGIFTTALSSIGAHKLGYDVNPEEILKFKMTGLYLSAVIKMINSPADKIYSHLPELASGVTLSALFGAAVSNADWINSQLLTYFNMVLPKWGYQINYGELLYQQAYLVGVLILIGQASKTIEVLSRDDTPQEAVPVAVEVTTDP